MGVFGDKKLKQIGNESPHDYIKNIKQITNNNTYPQITIEQSIKCIYGSLQKISLHCAEVVDLLGMIVMAAYPC